eukprot:CAMPEP_0119554326 /NCGR_PEP_ID=MMETSP1352-20130426/6852_1 /TAXON_ID=265584 /ORGANISM="Stauroneis constricta, Strain CCMP1120" /LENGTH=70 /DNA_ID=CAMNT_0007600901 /DNA_START=166 /DNA_END=374 /DNA_ORIENTATION=+
MAVVAAETSAAASLSISSTETNRQGMPNHLREDHDEYDSRHDALERNATAGSSKECLLTSVMDSPLGLVT